MTAINIRIYDIKADVCEQHNLP